MREVPMNCPYCQKETESGVIQSPHEIVWTRKKRNPLFRSHRRYPEGSVVLADFSLTGSAVPAYYCRTCRKIVIDPAGGSTL